MTDLSSLIKKMYKQLWLNKQQANVTDEYTYEWIESLHFLNSVSSSGKHKLRTYRNFKFTFETESYVQKLLPYKHRAALS